MTRLQLWVVAVVTASLMLGLGLIAPVLPLLSNEFDASATAIGVLMAAFPTGRLVSLYLAGMAADKFPFRRLGMAACALSGGAAALAGATFTIPTLVALQFFMGVGSATYTASATTHVINASAGERLGRNLGFYQTFVVAGVSSGPLVGAVVAERVGLRWPFFVYAMLCALGLAMTSRRGLIGEQAGIDARAAAATAGAADDGGAPPTATGVATPFGTESARRRAYALIGLAVIALFWVRTGPVNTLLPLFAFDELGIRVETIGYALTSTMVATMLFVPHAGRLADRRSPRGILAVGGVALAGCTVLLGLIEVTWHLFAVLFVFGAVTAYLLVTPQVFLARVTPPGRRGRAIGAHRTASALGMVLGPMSVGALFDNTTALVIFTIGAGVLVASAIALFGVPDVTSHPGASGPRAPVE